MKALLEAPLPWQTDQWDLLSNRIKENNLPHALLFSGPMGMGKQLFASAISKKLFCQSPQNHHSCGQCRDCKLFEVGSHPDYFNIQPEEDGKQIKIEQIRSVSNMLGKSSQRSGYRIVQISPAEKMNIAASNALLKTLEEPGDKTLIIIVSHAYNLLTPTIRSRCQTINFLVYDKARIYDWPIIYFEFLQLSEYHLVRE